MAGGAGTTVRSVNQDLFSERSMVLASCPSPSASAGTDPRHAVAYSPLWDTQLGLWIPKVVKEGLNTRQVGRR